MYPEKYTREQKNEAIAMRLKGQKHSEIAKTMGLTKDAVAYLCRAIAKKRGKNRKKYTRKTVNTAFQTPTFTHATTTTTPINFSVVKAIKGILTTNMPDAYKLVVIGQLVQ